MNRENPKRGRGASFWVALVGVVLLLLGVVTRFWFESFDCEWDLGGGFDMGPGAYPPVRACEGWEIRVNIASVVMLVVSIPTLIAAALIAAFRVRR